MTSLYDILGVPRSASTADIKSAYRSKAQKAHPDKPGGDAAAFAELNRAQRLLTDDTARKRYDETGTTDEQAPPMTDEQHAIIILGKMFIMMVEQSMEKGGDPIGACCMEIIKGMQAGPEQVTVQRRKVTKLEKALAKQLRRIGNGPSFLENTLTTHIATQKDLLAQMELAVRIGPLMLNILKAYRWQAERTQNYMPYPGIFMNLYRGP